jgi:hypothetical protein
MSHSIPSYGLRTLALVGALAGARVVTPAATQAQSLTPGQALLNRTAVAGPEAVKTDAVSVDGERALLGRVARPGTRRVVLGL